MRQLYVRRLDQLVATPIQGTETANSCFFSPDGEAIGLVSVDRTLKRVSLMSGLVVVLVRGIDFLSGGAWGPDDRITFGLGGTLAQLPPSEGTPQRLMTLDASRHELSQAWPSVTPDGKVILLGSTETAAG